MFSHLSPIAHPVRFRKGQLLFSEGDTAKGFWQIVNGAVRLYSLGEQGREAEIHRCEAGDIVGAAFALAQVPFPHFGSALSDCEALFFPTAQAIPRIVEHPPLARLFLRILAGKCSELTARISALQMQTVRDRLLYYLGETCPKDGSCTFRLPLSKRDLAQQLGTSPETLSRTLRDLQSEGILAVDNRQITVHACLRQGRCTGRDPGSRVHANGCASNAESGKPLARRAHLPMNKKVNH